jgi:hypothetical protein
MRLRKGAAAESTKSARWPGNACGDRYRAMDKPAAEAAAMTLELRAKDTLAVVDEAASSGRVQLYGNQPRSLATARELHGRLIDTPTDRGELRRVFGEQIAFHLLKVTSRHRDIPEIADVNKRLENARDTARALASADPTAEMAQGPLEALDDSGHPEIALECGRAMALRGLDMAGRLETTNDRLAQHVHADIAASHSGEARHAAPVVRRALDRSKQAVRDAGIGRAAHLFQQDSAFIAEWIGAANERPQPQRERTMEARVEKSRDTNSRARRQNKGIPEL